MLGIRGIIIDTSVDRTNTKTGKSDKRIAYRLFYSKNRFHFKIVVGGFVKVILKIDKVPINYIGECIRSGIIVIYYKINAVPFIFNKVK